MNTRPALRAVALGALLLPAVLLATGCSVVDRIAYNRADIAFDDRAALVADGEQDAAWVPADATDITGIAAIGGPDAVLRVHSDAQLDPAQCTETERRSAPVFALDDAPDVYRMTTVFACGDWTVAPTADGWLGWTPNHPDEAAESSGS